MILKKHGEKSPWHPPHHSRETPRSPAHRRPRRTLTGLLRDIHFGNVHFQVLAPLGKLLPLGLQVLAGGAPRGIAVGSTILSRMGTARSPAASQRAAERHPPTHPPPVAPCRLTTPPSTRPPAAPATCRPTAPSLSSASPARRWQWHRRPAPAPAGPTAARRPPSCPAAPRALPPSRDGEREGEEHWHRPPSPGACAPHAARRAAHAHLTPLGERRMRSKDDSAAACLGGGGTTWGRAQGARQPIERRVVWLVDTGLGQWGAPVSPPLPHTAPPPPPLRHVPQAVWGGKGGFAELLLWQALLPASPWGHGGELLLPPAAVQRMASPLDSKRACAGCLPAGHSERFFPRLLSHPDSKQVNRTKPATANTTAMLIYCASSPSFRAFWALGAGCGS